MPEPNRQERRREKYGGGRATDHGGWPTTQPNPIFGDESDVEPEAVAPANAAAAEGDKPPPSSKPKPNQAGLSTED
jgi:hypothetical protein